MKEQGIYQQADLGHTGRPSGSDDYADKPLSGPVQKRPPVMKPGDHGYDRSDSPIVTIDEVLETIDSEIVASMRTNALDPEY